VKTIKLEVEVEIDDDVNWLAVSKDGHICQFSTEPDIKSEASVLWIPSNYMDDSIYERGIVNVSNWRRSKTKI
jgi:hypothetical protein